jgi:hypothetical protein
MENRSDADAGAEMLWVCCDGGQGLGGYLEQQVIGAASSRRAASSGLSTTGSLRGSCTNAVRSTRSGRPSVTLKKNRSVETVWLRVGAPTAVRRQMALVATHVFGTRRIGRAAKIGRRASHLSPPRVLARVLGGGAIPRERFGRVLGMLSSLEVKVLYPT